MAQCFLPRSRTPSKGVCVGGGGGAGLCLKGRGPIGAVPEQLQSGHGGCESGWGGRFLAVGNAVGAGVGVWECLSGRVRAVARGALGCGTIAPSDSRGCSCRGIQCHVFVAPVPRCDAA